MPLRDRVREIVAVFKGQRSGLPPQAIQPGDSSVVNNMNLIQNQLKKINGITQYAQLESIDSTETVTWLDYFENRWLAQKNDGIFREVSQESGTFQKASLLNSVTTHGANKVYSGKYQGQVYICNGLERYYIDDNPTFALKSWGLLPPLGTLSSANVSTSNSTGSLTSNTQYFWTLTLYDNTTGVESPAVNSRPAGNGEFLLDPFSVSDFAPDSWTKTTGAADDTATFTFAEINALITGAYVSSRATYFRLYRTDINADAFKLCTNMSYNSVSVTDGTVPIAAFVAAGQPLIDLTADLDLGVILDTTKGPPPDAARMLEAYNHVIGGGVASQFGTYKHVKVFRDSIFGFGHHSVGVTGIGQDSFPAFDSVLAIGEPFLPDYIATSLEINNGDGQRATGLGALGDSTLFMFKERSAYYLLGTNPDNYTRRVLDTRRGAASPATIQESPVGVFTLDYSGIVLFDGTGPGKSLSNPDINDLIQRINFLYIDNSFSGYDEINEIYYVCVPVDGAQQPNLMISYSVRSEGFTIIDAITASSLHFDIDLQTEPVAMLGSRQNGLLLDWSLETETKILGNTIESTWLSGPMFFGEPMKRKKARFVYITAECAQDFTVDLDIVVDYGQAQDFSLIDINSASLFSVWAASAADSGASVGVWDSSYWGATKTQKTIKIPVYGVGYVFQVRIKNRQSDNDKYGFKILAVDFEAVLMGS